MPLSDVLWTRPVKVRLQSGLERTFTGVYDALDFLDTSGRYARGNGTSKR